MSNANPPLTAEQIESLKADLQRAANKLRRSMEISDEAARPVNLDQTAVGRLSRIDAMQNQSLTQGLQDRERIKASQLTEALQRIEDGTYGICTGCEGPIRYERLMLFPETRTCSACAS